MDSINQWWSEDADRLNNLCALAEKHNLRVEVDGRTEEPEEEMGDPSRPTNYGKTLMEVFEEETAKEIQSVINEYGLNEAEVQELIERYRGDLDDSENE